MKLSKQQQQIINCLGDGWNMLQSYTFPATLSKQYIWYEERCSNATIRKLLSLGLINYTVSGDQRFYHLTELGKEHITGKPIIYA